MRENNLYFVDCVCGVFELAGECCPLVDGGTRYFWNHFLKISIDFHWKQRKSTFNTFRPPNVSVSLTESERRLSVCLSVATSLGIMVHLHGSILTHADTMRSLFCRTLRRQVHFVDQQDRSCWAPWSKLRGFPAFSRTILFGIITPVVQGLIPAETWEPGTRASRGPGRRGGDLGSAPHQDSAQCCKRFSKVKKT